jgi:hypothetical protein
MRLRATDLAYSGVIPVTTDGIALFAGRDEPSLRAHAAARRKSGITWLVTEK